MIGATMNTSGSFRFEATKVGQDTALTRSCGWSRRRRLQGPIQRLADRISAVFVPAVIGVAAVTFLVWLLLGPAPALTFALLNTVAVLIIACLARWARRPQPRSWSAQAREQSRGS